MHAELVRGFAKPSSWLLSTAECAQALLRGGAELTLARTAGSNMMNSETQARGANLSDVILYTTPFCPYCAIARAIHRWCDGRRFGRLHGAANIHRTPPTGICCRHDSQSAAQRYGRESNRLPQRRRQTRRCATNPGAFWRSPPAEIAQQTGPGSSPARSAASPLTAASPIARSRRPLPPDKIHMLDAGCR